MENYISIGFVFKTESLQDKLRSELGDHGEIIEMGYIQPGPEANNVGF